MGSMLIINGSPRAPRSNSKKYAEILKSFWEGTADEYNVTEKKHEEVASNAGRYDHLLLVFPLYADGLSVTLMNFLKVLETSPITSKPVVHVLINCGFLEPEQNQTAVEIIRLFCEKNGFPNGMTLCVGSGEAILTTPFAFLVKRKIKKMVQRIQNGKAEILKVSMPLSKKMFISASEKYWTGYGEKNGITEKQMRTMKIEDE